MQLQVLKTVDVVSYGHALVDVQAKVDDSFLQRLGIKKGDMQLVTAAQAGWLYNQMPPATECSGGSGANSMAIVAALGGRAGFMGRTGPDTFGSIFTHDLKRQGVEYDPRIRDSACGETGRCLVLVTPDHKRTMNTYLGCSDTAGTADLDYHLIANSKYLLIEGYMFDGPSTRTGTLAAIEMAKTAGTKIALTLSSQSCIERNRDALYDIMLNTADLVLANDDEIKCMYRTDSYRMARFFAQRDCRAAVLTKGPEGADYISGRQCISVRAVPGVQVVDATGAGDAFAGGVLYGLAQGLSPTMSLRMAALCSAEVISHLGARPECDLKAFVAAGMKRQTTRSVRAESHKPG